MIEVRKWPIGVLITEAHAVARWFVCWGTWLWHVDGLAICQKVIRERDRLEGEWSSARSTVFGRVYKQQPSGSSKSYCSHSFSSLDPLVVHIHHPLPYPLYISIMRSFVIFVTLFSMFIMMTNALPIIKKRESGSLTFYTPGLGSCGKTNSESDMIAALSSSVMGSGDKCGQELSITYKGKDVSVTAVDTCPSCGSGDIDLSPAAFKALADLDEGRLEGASWNWG